MLMTRHKKGCGGLIGKEARGWIDPGRRMRKREDVLMLC